ncbi:toll/interleukin-1 receptor domain-containing protein [Arcicella lustrica]|uniref:Toll/interleukin-1 receptor domain-containing protein n=1 Tax=Arcicella lustrica TaxID=2984196 RepID=A0ABU5SLS4_9BACT|nr:toll/interleukin-1 receptor domain-containing protein [Arcicella sp. DC25W]MEA5428270.1 toll/interleukin-1 receptor domain-containing protein [Arcicella sp. DC25W]
MYSSPLSIYVLWHPNFSDGVFFANKIYQNFNRDTDYVLSRNLNIPVFYRNKANKNNEILSINFQESDKNAIVLLIDDNMFNDAIWEEYVSNILPNLDDNNRIYPIVLSSVSNYFLEENNFSRFQSINLMKTNNLDKQWEILKSRLLHDITRMMLDLQSVNDVVNTNTTITPRPPVKLFLSHAKADGEELAISFKNYIENNLKANTFFDTNDIADGYDFSDEINRNIDKNTAMIVFLTDAYSTREWCQIEVSTAKRKKCPIVVVHHIQKQERRSFPYLGNVPTIKWNGSFNDIIDLAIIQVLVNLFAQKFLEKHIALYDLEKKYHCHILSNPPELFNYLDILKLRQENTDKPVLVLYPDPPLGNEELKILNEVNNDINFVTPSHSFQYL